MIADKLREIIGPDLRLLHPEVMEHGDYAVFAKNGADELVEKLKKCEIVDKVEKSGNFVNIFIKNGVLVSNMVGVPNESMKGKKIMVEFAHPNTHKEMHIGHMRTLITGEAIARILENVGVKVFRANYQGDIGPHVAKAIWGTQKILTERNIKWVDADKMGLAEKAHLLGEGYVRGNTDYEANQSEIDGLNKKMYQKSADIEDIYKTTRRWSLEYYEAFYKRFGTNFDRLFFESEVADDGKRIVENNMEDLPTGRQVFEKSDGAVVFKGEHTRVFVTADGNPTYEGKEMALAQAQYEEFKFDKNIHVVANEQTGYFKVVIAAIEKLWPELVGKEYHLPMGMVNLVGRKMSSRTGEILRVDALIDEIKGMLPQPMEEVALGAVKYSVLKNQPTINVAFDPEQSVNLEGNSGPYLQYTYARCKSVLNKAGTTPTVPPPKSNFQFAPNVVGGGGPQTEGGMNPEELSVVRFIYRFPEVVEEAAERLAPNLICNFLFELAQRYNTFYNKHSILSPKSPSDSLFVKEGGAEAEGDLKKFRLYLTSCVSEVLKQGLYLLGIEAPERM